MKINMVEACRDSSRGSIGAWYIAERARMAGHDVHFGKRTRSGFDVELISVHHCTDFPRLAQLPKRATWRIVGGHPLSNNPRPVIPFTDAMCIGEGESWINDALQLLGIHHDIAALSVLPGTIISENWRMGDSIPTPNVERPLPDNPPYLNHAGRKKAWYIEIARGCPYSCAFCELGHSMPPRKYGIEHIKSVLAMADTSITRKINFYAPDEASHPQYHELFAYLLENGYSASFSSMRIDSILKRGLPALKNNHLIRVGIDGLSEATRFRVNKKITDDMIVEYFRQLIERGHVYFKVFMIFGYPWEVLEDFKHFENLMDRLRSRIPLEKNIILRIKWTPFIPQPCTPLGEVEAKYDFDMVRKIEVWHALNARPFNRGPGWHISSDGMVMGYRSHKRQCELTRGDEAILAEDEGVHILHEVWK